MNKKELLEKLKTFDDDADVVFVSEADELLTLDSDGMDINRVLEVNNGIKKVIALVE